MKDLKIKVGSTARLVSEDLGTDLWTFTLEVEQEPTVSRMKTLITREKIGGKACMVMLLIDSTTEETLEVIALPDSMQPFLGKTMLTTYL